MSASEVVMSINAVITCRRNRSLSESVTSSDEESLWSAGFSFFFSFRFHMDVICDNHVNYDSRGSLASPVLSPHLSPISPRYPVALVCFPLFVSLCSQWFQLFTYFYSCVHWIFLRGFWCFSLTSFWTVFVIKTLNHILSLAGIWMLGLILSWSLTKSRSVWLKQLINWHQYCTNNEPWINNEMSQMIE